MKKISVQEYEKALLSNFPPKNWKTVNGIDSFETLRFVFSRKNGEYFKSSKIKYQDYSKLIKKIAGKFARKTGMEFEEVEAEANVIFVECLNAFDPNKGKFSTLLTVSIWSRYINILKKKNSLKYHNIQVEYLDTMHGVSPELDYLFKNTLASLSTEAKEIIDIVFNTPAELLNTVTLSKPNLNLSISRIKKYLVNKNWKSKQIFKTINEIKAALN